MPGGQDTIINRHERRAAGKVGWRIPEWSRDVGCGKSTTNELIREKKIDSVKLGTARIITTPPGEFLASLAAEQAPAAA